MGNPFKSGEGMKFWEFSGTPILKNRIFENPTYNIQKMAFSRSPHTNVGILEKPRYQKKWQFRYSHLKIVAFWIPPDKNWNFPDPLHTKSGIS